MESGKMSDGNETQTAHVLDVKTEPDCDASSQAVGCYNICVSNHLETCNKFCPAVLGSVQAFTPTTDQLPTSLDRTDYDIKVKTELTFSEIPSTSASEECLDLRVKILGMHETGGTESAGNPEPAGCMPQIDVERKCTICKVNLSSVKNVTHHMYSHTRPFHCEQCDKTFARKDHLKRHMVMHSGERPHPCLLCDRSFLTSYEMRQHELRQHAEPQPQAATKGGPANATERRFPCPECDRSYARPFDLKQHMVTHSGERPYSCKECQKSFAYMSVLTEHMRQHTGEFPHRCSVCNKAFRKSSNLHQHVLTHTGEQPYQCPECGRRFTGYSNMKKHLRTHSAEMPYLCKECSRRFNRLDQLKRHMVTHSDARPYPCTQCDLRFKLSDHLRNHLRTHAAKAAAVVVGSSAVRPGMADGCGAVELVSDNQPALTAGSASGGFN